MVLLRKEKMVRFGREKEMKMRSQRKIMENV
jgi:hypothetical protein